MRVKKPNDGQIKLVKRIGDTEIPVFVPRIIAADQFCGGHKCGKTADFAVAGLYRFEFFCAEHAYNAERILKAGGHDPKEALLKLHTIAEFEQLRLKNEVKQPPIDN